MGFPLTSPSGLPKSSVSSKSFITRLAVGGLLVNLFVASLVVMSSKQNYRHYQEQAEINSQNLARALENEIAGSIRAIDVTLIGALQDYQEYRALGVYRKTFNVYLERLRAHLPEIDALRIANAKGMLIFGNDVIPDARTSIVDRPHFIRLRDDPQAGLIISKPQISRASQKWEIMLSRRIEQPDGSFDGIVTAVISLEHLSRTFAAIDVGPRGSIVLRDDELGFVSRHPKPTAIGKVIGYRDVPPQLQEMVQTGHKSATFRNHSTLDDIERTYSHRRVDDLPFFIAVGLASDDYLAEWRRQTRKTWELAVLFFLMTLFSSWLIYRGWMRQKEVSDQLEVELGERTQVEMLLRDERDFADNLIDTTQAIILVLDLHGQIIRFNPYLEAISGYSLDEMRGKDWFGTFLPTRIQAQTRALFLKTINDISTHGNVSAIITRDGQERLIEWHDKTLKNADGNVVGLLATGLDVTERKLADQKINEYHDHLEEMVLARTAELVQALEKLQETERREHAMLDNLPVGVRLSSGVDNKTLYLNPRFVEMFGYTIEDIPHLTQWWSLAYPDPEYRTWIDNEWKQRLATDSLLRRDADPLEVNIAAKDGTVKFIRIHAASICGLNLVTFIDLSDRKWAEEAINELNNSLEQRVVERTQALMEAMTRVEKEIKTRVELERHLLKVSEEERLHIGSELHDNVGQTLTAVGLFRLCAID